MNYFSILKKGVYNMLKLSRYLKPYVFLIILSLTMLFGQGMAELFLPNLMSDIVNIGIQRSGIEHSAPEALSEDAFGLLCSLMGEENRALFEKGYDKTEINEEYIKRYPALANGISGLYVQNGSVAPEELDSAANCACTALMLTIKDFSEKTGITSENNSSSSDSIDLSAFYAFLETPYFTTATEKHIAEAEKYDPTVSSQAGASFAQVFYRELGADLSAMRTGYLFRLGGLMVLITLCSAAASIAVSFIAARVGAGIARNLRSDIFRKVEGFTSAEFDKFSTASLITRTTNDVNQVQLIVTMGLRMICYAPILGIGGAILAASTSLSMSWIIVLAIVLLFVIMIIVLLTAMPKFKVMQKMIDRLNLVTRESLSGLLVIRAFGTERYEEQRFDKANKDLTSVNLFVNRVMTFLMPLMTIIMNGVSMLVVWVGAHLIEQSQMQIGDMMAFIQYSMMIIMSFLMIAVMFVIIPRASVSGGRIAEVLGHECSIKDPDDPELLENVRGEVRFENVCFRYEGAENDVLHDISFTAEPGRTTAFIGTTGSGKTTLISLIPRFYDVTEGSVKIDGIDVRSVTQHDLREQIGIVPQKGMLFSGDISSNLRYGRRTAGDDEIQLAAQTAMASEFIEKMPEGYSSVVSQGGTNYSGGQKQRLAIARALVKKAPVYIFDDSFSALDFRTDAALRKALKKYTGNSTVIIVAQRISTIMHADKIIVLDGGRIVGSGTHNELLESCDAYREIAVSQNSANKV